MAILLDADVIIEAEGGTFDLFAWIEAHAEEEIRLAAITVAELRMAAGLEEEARRQRREFFVDRILDLLEVVPYGEGTVGEHVRLQDQLNRTGKSAGAYDVMLAAIAMERRDVVAVFDTTRFENLPGVRVIKPS